MKLTAILGIIGSAILAVALYIAKKLGYKQAELDNAESVLKSEKEIKGSKYEVHKKIKSLSDDDVNKLL